MQEKTVGPAVSWRMVYDGTQVLCLFESGGYTSTRNQLFEASTKNECYAEIARLGLVAPIEDE
jgi:hypothetical protein